MKKIFSILRIHWLAIVILFAIGVISSVPQYSAPQEITGFQGIYHAVADDQIYYEARAKDVLDGHSNLVNPYFAEHKSGSPMQFWLPDYVVAKLIGFLGVSIPVGFIIWNAILTCILALLSYAIVYVLTRSRGWGVLSMLFLNVYMFGMTFLRLPSPAFNFVFWMTTLLCMFLYIHTHKKIYAIIGSLSFGFLFHLYPYFWTFFVVLIGIYVCAAYVLRLKNFPYKTYIAIAGGAFIIGIPYFLSVMQSSHLTVYAESLRRLGLITTHFPSGILSVVISGCMCGIYGFTLWHKKLEVNELSVFIFSLLATTAVVVNQHIVTGKNVEFSSHYLLGNMFTFAVVGIFICYLWWKECGWRTHRNLGIAINIIGYCVVIVLAFMSLVHIVNVETVYTSYDIRIQTYAPVFRWFNQHAEPDEVVYTNDDIGYYLPVYTSQNVYYSAFGILFFMSDKEVQERFIINHYFDIFTKEYVIKNQRMMFGGYYINEYGHRASINKVRNILGMNTLPNVLVPEPVVSEIISEADSIQKQSFEKVIKTYNIHYIVWDSNKNPEWKIPKDFTEVFSESGITIYKVQ